MKLIITFSVLFLHCINQIYSETDYYNIYSNIAIIRNEYYTDKCLGAVIHPLWVITSGVCALKTLYQDKRVFFNLRPEPFENGTYIESIKIHPEFNQKNLSNDVALLKLATATHKSIHILKISKFYGVDLTAQKPYSIRSLNGENFICRRPSSVVILSEELCAKYPVIQSNTTICGYPSVACEGDEGGPLILNGVLIAVTSITPLQAALCRDYVGCNDLIPVTTFTLLEPYRKWIIEVTGSTFI